MLRRLYDAVTRRPAKPGGSDAAVAPVLSQQWRARGNAALAASRIDEAAHCYREAVAADPADPLAHLNLGFALLEQGDWRAALASLQQALALRRPGDDFVHEAHFLAGRAQEAGGQPDLALASMEAAVQARADFVPAIEQALRIAQGLARPAEAVRWAQRLVAVTPTAFTRFVLANELAGCGRDAESASVLAEVCAEEPQQLEAALLYFHVLFRLQRFEQALAQAAHVLALTGPDAGSLVNLAATLEKLDRLEEALARVEEALLLDPARRDGLVNRVAILLRQRRVREAAEAARRALDVLPDDAVLHMHLGFALLLLGDFARGWEEHEWRLRGPMFSGYRVPAQYPLWRGESLHGKSIFVYGEQGFGDGIQFVRYVPELARQAREVILQLPEGLAPLAGGLAPNCRQLPQGAAMPAIDFHCPLMSLPHVLGTDAGSVPAAVPYLRAQPQRVADWRARLGQGPHVGIAWSGNPTHVNDRNRSIRLDVFRQLACPGWNFVSLQPEVREHDRGVLAAWPQLRDCGGALRDFSETAALVDALDLVITVDTSVAHLAGALGRPVWILLPWVPDWRWMLEGERTPWYPTARLYRQPGPGDWGSVLARVRADLGTLAAGSCAGGVPHAA